MTLSSKSELNLTAPELLEAGDLVAKAFPGGEVWSSLPLPYIPSTGASEVLL